MDGTSNMRVVIALGIIALFGIITFALVAATLGTLNQRYDRLDKQVADLMSQVISISQSSSTTTTEVYATSD
ncbi:unnamed protein product [Adineta ricciae]|nr:unnamed protein product [Adineta ricciae]